jgi:hypothetical protein
MIGELLQRNIVSNAQMANAGSIANSLAAAAVLLLGFPRLEHLELTPIQLYLATVETLGLAAAFVILACLLQVWRRTGGRNVPSDS